MEKASRFSKVLAYQGAGFLTIMGLCWLDELIALPSLVFPDNSYISYFPESTIKMVVVLGVWFLVGGATGRLLDHIKHLEEFLRVCSWCHKIKYKGKWMKMEDYMEQSFDTPTTHGICTCCLERQRTAIREAKEARRRAEQQPAASLA